MKIIQLVTQMEAGGAQKVASFLTEGLRKRGHDAQMWFLYKKTAAYEESSHVRSLAPQRPAAEEFLNLGVHLWKELRRHRPDAIITHTHSANAFAAPIATLARVPVRVAVHHNPIQTYSLPMRVADRCAFSSGCYSSMVTVSGGVMKSFAEHSTAYQRRLHRIYNAVSLEDSTSDVDVRTRYGVPAHVKLLVNVGRLAAQKNQSLLLHLLQRIPDAFLMLVGQGDMQRELFAEAVVLGVAQRVKFTGEVSAERVGEILRAADLFLMPSIYESFCLAAVEAMHCHVPVIASDIPCLREVLGDSQLFFPLNNIVELTRNVQYVLTHRAAGEQMGIAGHLQAERFTIKRMVGEYESLLLEALLYARPRKINTERFSPTGYPW